MFSWLFVLFVVCHVEVVPVFKEGDDFFGFADFFFGDGVDDVRGGAVVFVGFCYLVDESSFADFVCYQVQSDKFSGDGVCFHPFVHVLLEYVVCSGGFEEVPFFKFCAAAAAVFFVHACHFAAGGAASGHEFFVEGFDAEFVGGGAGGCVVVVYVFVFVPVFYTLGEFLFVFFEGFVREFGLEGADYPFIQGHFFAPCKFGAGFFQVVGEAYCQH